MSSGKAQPFDSRARSLYSAAIIKEPQEFDVMYGDVGSHDCFITLCAGISLDLDIEHFASCKIKDQQKVTRRTSKWLARKIRAQLE